jgi:hypothetical protein
MLGVLAGGAIAVIVGLAIGVFSSPSEGQDPKLQWLDNNGWVVRGAINPRTHRFCQGQISSLVPDPRRDRIYVLCDRNGRIAGPRP